MIETNPRKIELLAPAKDADTAIAAIDHGADAVYIGASSFGARHAASNPIEDIRRVVDYAHQFRVKIYATVNTILYDRELPEVEKLCGCLYRAGVDALIVQDMGLLRLNLPPIELHASTQCDTRTVDKARFLEKVGFSQIVLARELTLGEIEEVCRNVNVPVEAFVHGALCVSYSGRCHAGEFLMGRSANRGKCPQVCRMKFDLVDSEGRTLARDRQLLSLKDFNASTSVKDLLKAGVSSFKIEGRLKDTAYVKNVTAYYRKLIDSFISDSNGTYIRSSCGATELRFEPNLFKSFNRGFTSYFVKERKPSEQLASIFTPKSLGEPLRAGQLPNNGDGISFFNPTDKSYSGFRVNKVEKGRIIPARPIRIPKGVTLYRTFDNEFEKLMSRTDTAVRKIAVDVELYSNRIKGSDERGCVVEIPYDADVQDSQSPDKFRKIFEKTGNTIYWLRNFISYLPNNSFVRPSELTALRRRLLEELDGANEATYPFSYRRQENQGAIYPYDKLDFRDNLANKAAEAFYKSHGVKEMEWALETTRKKARKEGKSIPIMNCRYCILRQIGKCLADRGEKRKAHAEFRLPLHLRMTDGRELPLTFDCRHCEMTVHS